MGRPTFSHALSSVATRYPNRCAFHLPRGGILTFAALYFLVEAVAAWLCNSGVGHGDVAFLVCPNTVEFLVLLLAVLRCRAAAVPIDPFSTREYFETCFCTYLPKLLLIGTDGDPTMEAAAAAHGVPHAVASVHYVPSDAVHTSAFVRLTLPNGDLIPLVPATISSLVNEPEDLALFLPPVDTAPNVPVTRKEFMAFIRNFDLAQSRLRPLFQAHSLLGDLVYSLSTTLAELDNEDKAAIKYALKLNELALSMSTSFMVAMSMFLIKNNLELIQTNMWVAATLLLFFVSFVLSLAGVQYHPILRRSSEYIGNVALFAFFSGVATTAISVLPQKQSLVASVVASLYVGLLTILIMIRGGAGQLHPRGRIRETAAKMAAAAAAAAAASPITETGAETA